MSHEIRTPMNAIIGMTNIASMHIGDQEKIEDCLKKISSSSQHLLGLINDVLDMSKIESGNIALNLESISLPAVLEEVVTIMQPVVKGKEQDFSIRLHNVHHEDLLCDSLRLRQIFINILSNASKFTPEGGSIVFEITELISDEPGTARFQFMCTDSGIGIRPEFLPNLFDAFTRERDSRVDQTEGSGLGLAIAKKLTELFGGTITVESQLGKGSAFSVVLPMRITSHEERQNACTDLNILVVDNDRIACEYLVQTLDELGAHAVWTDNGSDAVDQVLQLKNADEGFDAVLLDWKMPGMDGIRTAQAIRQVVGRDLPIILTSAYDWSDIRDEIFQDQIDGFLQKPLFKSSLCDGIQRYVLKGQHYQENERLNSLAGRMILLVEDNQLNLEIAVELLTMMGTEVEIAEDGQIAVQKVSHSAEGYYDVILMDVQMPNMNGYEATRRIRALPREDVQNVPIIAMTADAFSEDVEAAKKAGMNSHLAKPFTANSLNREILKVL